MPMTNEDVQRLLNNATVFLPGVSSSALKATLFDTLHEFFDKSDSWTEDVLTSVQSGVVDYDIVPAEGGLITRLVGVLGTDGMPVAATMPEFGRVHLAYDPGWNGVTGVTGVTGTYQAVVIKNITMPTTPDLVPVAPDWVLPQYERTILAGLLWKMMIQRGKSWTDDAEAPKHSALFAEGIVAARLKAQRMHNLGFLLDSV